MLTATTTSLALALLPELDQELQLTRRVLERVPEDYFGWQPHPRSMTLGQLATHTAGLLGGISTTFNTTEVDLATYTEDMGSTASNAESLLQTLAENGDSARAALLLADEAAFEQAWTLRHGEQVILSQPRAGVVRHLISHTVHHRGQLSVYLRLLDIPVPAIYGPSADDANFIL
jgi:uncharacterized damage-inducible protein DinB